MGKLIVIKIFFTLKDRENICVNLVKKIKRAFKTTISM